MQKRIIRIITFAHKRDHTCNLFKNTGILTIQQLYKSRLALFVYNCIRGLYPPGFDNICIPLGLVQVRPTRQSSKMLVPKVYCESTKRSPGYQGAVLYNQLVLLYDESRSPGYFKRELKRKLVNGGI